MGSPNIEMDENAFLVNRERAIDYLNNLDKVFVNGQFLNWAWDPEHKIKVRIVYLYLPELINPYSCTTCGCGRLNRVTKVRIFLAGLLGKLMEGLPGVAQTGQPT